MASVLDKICLYGGWFYLSLLGLVIAAFLVPKTKELVFKIAIFLTIAISLFYFVSEMKKIPLYWQDFTLSYQEKIDKATFNQETFSKQIEEALPEKAEGCILWSWDIPTLFLIQRLYPLKFSAVDKVVRTDCPYLISQFKPMNLNGYRLIMQAKGGYLYKRL